MRHFTVQVTPLSECNQLTEALKHKVAYESFRSAQDTMIFEQAVLCISDFCERAAKSYSNGTTLQVAKRFDMSLVSFTVRLDCPGKKPIISKTIYKLLGNI